MLIDHRCSDLIFSLSVWAVYIMCNLNKDLVEYVHSYRDPNGFYAGHISRYCPNKQNKNTMEQGRHNLVKVNQTTSDPAP